MLDKVRTRLCHHCRATVPEATALQADIDGTPHTFCCQGCAAAAQLIDALALQSFYDYRDSCDISTAAPDTRPALGLEDYQPAVTQTADGSQTLRLLIPDIRCVACVWLLEHVLRRQSGVEDVRVHFARRRLQVRFRQPAQLPALVGLIQQLGYSAVPDLPDARRDAGNAQRRTLLIRLGVAGLCMMPVMMFAIASYLAGAPTPQNPASGMDPLYETLLRWASLALTTPVVFYSAAPFHRGAWQSLRHCQLGMDLPVSLAILAAWALSVYNTLSFGSAVYFDTACMFTFLLLLGRHVELISRQHFEDNEDSLLRLLPGRVWRRSGSGDAFEAVPLHSIVAGDLLRVLPGETIPADGVLVEGTASISDSAFTGEPLPVLRVPGARVLAGAMNHDGTLLVRASCAAQDYLITQIARLHEEATAYRPRWSLLADRAAGWFIGSVLVLSVAAGVYWYLAGSAQYWVIALTVLVVACPCALSLATPVAITVATTTLRRHGVLIRNGAFLERAARTSAVAFDKTGTLTEAALRIDAIVPLGNMSASTALALATALERHSQHPIARAFAQNTALEAADVSIVAGGGVQGRIDGICYRIGHAAFASGSQPAPAAPSEDGLWVLLCAQTPIAWIQLQDTLRPQAQETVALLRRDGLRTALFSGDSSAAGRRMAAALQADILQTGMSPAEKIAAVRALGESDTVMMVGDGINDAGAMAAAACSIAVTPRDVLVQHSADATLLSPSLPLLPAVLRFARRTRRIIRQNLGWSLAYNLSAIPLALLGMLPPWLAAIGMSLSSLLVVLNAGRLRRMEG